MRPPPSGPSRSTPMSAENLAIARRWFDDIWNQRRLETVDELLTPDSVCFVDDGPIRGPEEFKQRMYHPFVSALPDTRVEILGELVQGDQVAIRWKATGTHDGEGLGCRATRQPVEIQGISWLVIRGGKLVEGWQSSNITDVVRGLVLAAGGPLAPGDIA
ncbi:ester cyclase [Tundrisphaera sp. TA3]|uniref:ester cyclase n=1 Tax=Tundrisphaera sp. TA3 TaxID=3435775 RepID=UPI003EB8A92E